jgi:hypothetical protein
MYISSKLFHPKANNFVQLEGMKIMKPGLLKVIVTASCFLVISACSSVSSDKQAGSSTSNQATWDVDSRNNENATLGTKNVTNPSLQGMQSQTKDNRAALPAADLMLRDDLAEQVVRAAHVPNASVAVANQHVYVAVDLGERRTEVWEQVNSNDRLPGAGIFGTGTGAQLDWRSGKLLTKQESQTIFNEMRRSYPNATIYMSTNPNFANRMLFYSQQKKLGKDVGAYVNEFNTMVQYVFPE